MIDGQTRTVLHYLRRRVGTGAATDESADRELLQRFVAVRDEAAFQTLMQRHGPMVLRVCRRLLDDRHDAEDAFQATFLVLARKAAAVAWHASAGSWLYAVAHRLAREARRRTCRRWTHEARVPYRPSVADPLSEISGRELLAVIDEELVRLPERYRAPIVLCCLEGHAGEEAARQLDCSLSTLRRRLDRGRELLRVRLTRRGILLSAAALSSALLLENVAPASVPAVLAGLTARAATLLAAGRSLTGTASEGAAGLAEKVVNRMLATRLKIAAAVVLAVGMVSTAAGVLLHRTSATAADEKPRETAAREAGPVKPVAGPEKGKDLLGDPLPPGALARLGTTRLRGHRWLYFFPDGRRLLRDRSDGGLQVFEVPSGKPLAVIRAKDMQRGDIIGSTVALSRDGKYVAAVCWEGQCGVWESATGRLVRKIESGLFYSIVRCDFSPDGKLLAVGGGAKKGAVAGNTVGVYDVSTGRQLFTTPGTNSVFAPDGRSLIAWHGYGRGSRQTAYKVAVPDGETLARFSYHEEYPDGTPRSDGVWFLEATDTHAVSARDCGTGEQKHIFYGGPPAGADDVAYVRHAPGRREVILARTAPAGVWCWDLETGKELWQTKLAAPTYYPSLSADGSTLVTGEKTGAVRVWDAATGKERLSFRPGLVGHEAGAVVSPDGRVIATTSGNMFASATAFWDAATGKLLSDLPGHSSGVSATAFTPDGSAALTIASDRTLRAWDPATGRERSRVTAEPAEHLAVAPDGSALFTAGPGGTVRVLHPGTGRVAREIPVFKRSLVGLALTADGKRLVAAGRDGEASDGYCVRVHDAATGAKLAEFGGSGGVIEQLAVRPDGGAVAASFVGQRVVVWDGGGKVLTEQVGHGERVASWAKGETPYRIGSIGLSRDGRWLAYSDQEKGVALVDLRTGRETGRARQGVYFQKPSARYEVRDVLAFSPDGKTVAWSGVESTTQVVLIEVRSAKVRRRLKGDSFLVQRLAFSPDGSKLLSAGPDGSALVWDVFGRAADLPPVQASAEQAAGWWKLFADPDAEDAYGAMREMTANPAAAVALLREKLKPVKEAEAAKLNALLAGLDGDSFDEREAASRDLVALGDAAEQRLRETRRKSPGPEVARRVDEILDRIEAGRLPSERAVEVLEMIGDRAAIQLLREWAGGMPGAGRTVDAAGALERMTRLRGRTKER